MAGGSAALVNAPVRGLLFRDDMVRSVQRGWKIRTTRLLTKQTAAWKVGDFFYVRETHAIPPGSDDPREVVYRADVGDLKEEQSIRRLTGRSLVPWRPNMHMPRKFARILIRLESIDISYLQQMTSAMCIQEGARGFVSTKPTRQFPDGDNRTLWSMKCPHPIEDPTCELPSEHCLFSPQMAFANYWNELAPIGRSWEDNPRAVSATFSMQELEAPA